MSTPLSNWVPEICYEEEVDGISSHIPFIQVPAEEDMPKILYVFESRETGEYEPGFDGEPIPVIQLDLHQYADLSVLKSKFGLDAYNTIRDALGLEPLDEAVEKGQKITDTIREKLEHNTQKTLPNT